MLKMAVPAIISPTCPVQLATVSALSAPVVAKIRNVVIIRKVRIIFDHGKFRQTGVVVWYLLSGRLL